MDGQTHSYYDYAVKGMEKQTLSIVQSTGNFILRPVQGRPNDKAREFRILVLKYLNCSGNGPSRVLTAISFWV